MTQQQRMEQGDHMSAMPDATRSWKGQGMDSLLVQLQGLFGPVKLLHFRHQELPRDKHLLF